MSTPVKVRATVAASCLGLLALTALPSEAGTAVPQASGLRPAGGAVTALANQLAAGQSALAARTICRSGLVRKPAELGRALAEADLTVIARGGSGPRIKRFTIAVDRAYARAGVPHETASGSFGIGLAHIVEGYAAGPTDLYQFWGRQAILGADIIYMAADAWVATATQPSQPCAGLPRG